MTINLNENEFQLVLKGLLELPAKESLNLILKLGKEKENPAPAFKMATATKENK